MSHTINSGGARNRNVDCFKIFLMVLIVAHHGIVHGLGLKNIVDVTTSGRFELIYFVANAFLIIAVNCFFWISGYYKIKRRLSRVIELVVEAMIYVLLLNIVVCVTNNNRITSILDVLKMFKNVLLFYQGYWFLSSYLIVFIFAPYLNKMTDVLSSREKKEALFVFFGVGTICGFVLNLPSLDNGYSVVQGIYMYLLGALCRTDDIQERFKSNSKLLKVTFVIFGFLNGLLSYVLYIKGHGAAAWRMFSYNNPIVVFMAVVACLSVIHCSKKLKIFDELGRLSQYTLSIYLLTDYDSI